MPNWVRNRVKAVNKEDTDALIKMLVKDDGKGGKSTNFNGIIPMPKELMNTTMGYGKPEWDEEHKRCKEKYGYETWWHFATEKWGTKWDNNNVTIDGCSIVFDTAWSAPYGIYEEISRTIPIVVAYADEDIGSNYGIAVVSNGDVMYEDIQGTDSQIANAIWKWYSEDEEDADKYSDEVQNEIDKIFS